MDTWPPKNGESSTTSHTEESTNSSAQASSSEQPSNRVIMLLGLDPNTTTGMITKAFDSYGLKVTVDYQRDDTIGYVHLQHPIAKEVTERIMSSGGLRIGTEVSVLRALEGMEDLMYWSVYAGRRIISRSSVSYKTGKNRVKRLSVRQHPYNHQRQFMDVDDEQTSTHHRQKLQVKTLTSPIVDNQFVTEARTKRCSQSSTYSSLDGIEDYVNSTKVPAYNIFIHQSSKEAEIVDRSKKLRDFFNPASQNQKSLSNNTFGLNSNPFHTIPYHRSPLRQELKLEGKDEADEVEEIFKNLYLNSVDNESTL
ncbi:29000_t:CDS:2 [Gigaspora margarita]|uniref:29000_t:CDS:1 n=1 Tax=Gigaspora margarita TaxID=4874 RepID=A0ABN7UX43_GIGMA|nr:29000_t:CDS:2 [Gigaspora margarita]